MSIEQTNQLILLMLNSVLMTLLSSLLLGGAWLRQNTLLQQLQKMRGQSPAKGGSHYRQITGSSAFNTTAEPPTYSTTTTHRITHPSGLPPELKHVRASRQQLSKQYQWSRVGMLILHTTLLTFSVSLFALSLRSLLPFDSLISAALFLFTVGAAELLIGCGCILIDFAKGNARDESLGQTLAKILQQLNHQWKRNALKLGRANARPNNRSAAQTISQSRPVNLKSTGASASRKAMP